MYTTLFKRFAIALLFTVGLARWAAADPIEELAAQIKADHAYVLNHPQTVDPEVMRLRHDAWMVKDMEERDKEVRADHAAYNEHLAKWVEENKNKFAAEQLAKAKAAQEEIEKKRLSSHTWVTMSGPNGTTSLRYDGLNQPTDRIDSSYGVNGSVTRYTNLENK